MPEAATIEAGLPEWRRDLNRFCENWIFAFVVAFAIRHFCLELFRIPSASMEPMLYGDPGLFKGDFVVVDKLTQRFKPIQRWDVAVFQYPVPEVESARGERARPAITADGDRIDSPVFRPLLGGNFVKRAVVLPGEEFYISGGDMFLRAPGPDHGWVVARKPAALQEVLWLPIYHAGEQPGYRPWAGLPPGDQPADGLVADLADGAAVTFTQPLRNLYLKPGAVAVRPCGNTSSEAWVRVDDVAMTKPQFTYAERTGSLWDLDSWELKRLTSADEDDPTRKGRPINELMTEWTGDLRISFRLGQVTGNPRLRISNRALGSATDARDVELGLATTGWKVSAPGVTADGSRPLAGALITFAQVDGQVVLTIDGSEVLRREIPWADPNTERPGISWVGPGRLEVSALAVDRDLHWCRKGFLVENRQAADLGNFVAQMRDQQRDAESLDSAANSVRLARTVRAEILAKSEGDLTRAEAIRAYGSGPDNPARAPSDGYLMLGDNSPLSMDGREWGFVPALNMRGRALMVIFPPTRWRVIR